MWTWSTSTSASASTGPQVGLTPPPPISTQPGSAAARPPANRCALIVAGVNCEVNFDDCASNPCDYGMCKDGINRYDCVCKPGFTGEPPVENGRRPYRWTVV